MHAEVVRHAALDLDSVESHSVVVRHTTLGLDLIDVCDLSPVAESHVVTADVRVEAQRNLILSGQCESLVADVDRPVDQSLPAGAGYRIMVAVPRYTNRGNPLAEVKSQDLAVHAAIEAEACLRAKAEGHDLATIVRRGLIADMAGHRLSPVTRCHRMKTGAFVQAVVAGQNLSAVTELDGMATEVDAVANHNLSAVAACENMVTVAAVVAVAGQEMPVVEE